ncbi:MAG: hypothetical protein V2I33_08545 [Kangiellaceae bacterium]|jgi:hypothetical protein|nr:hypothetical protein [Kangiellaceae bacterium]
MKNLLNKMDGTQLGYLFIAVYFVLGMMMEQASAIDLLSYKDTNTGAVTIARASVETAWAANQPACLKEGAKLIGVNKAFKAANLGYRDCSNSPARKKIHSATGLKVTVFRLSDLPLDMIKEIKSK